LSERFGVTEFPSDAPPLVDVARHHELAAALKGLGYRLLVCVTASHWPGEASEDNEVAYFARTIGPGTRVAAWRVLVPVGVAVPSLCDLFAAADWQEREQFDLVGVQFSGHPDLRRIMMPEDYPWHPLRKDRAADAAWSPWR
jgi:NADH-quinone oxidoreductase subunit C